MTESLHFCSYFDHRYLARALCLYNSLRTHSPPFVWHVLALSEPCERILQKLSLLGVVVTSLKDLEAGLPQLLKAKSNRTLVEYYFTLTAAFCQFILDRVSPNVIVTYLDSDLHFYRSPVVVLDELNNASVGIIEHRFSQANRSKIVYGRFNVGWLSFRNDRAGRRCLKDWFEKCIEWCFDRLDDERFADQKYLDKWPQSFPGVRIIENRGANVALWNVADSTIAPDCSDERPITLNGVQLIFAHFQNVRGLGLRTYETGFDMYNIDPGLRPSIARHLYSPYLRKLHAAERSLSKLMRAESGVDRQELRQGKRLLPDHRMRTLLSFPSTYLLMISKYNWITI